MILFSKKSILINLFFVQLLLSTPQTPDLLIVNRDTLYMRAFPLEIYFQQKGINSYNLLDSLGFTDNTSCYRRYQALWELKSDSLFLNSIHECNDNRKLDVSQIFPSSKKDDEIFAGWVSEKLIVVFGKLLLYEHHGWGGYYEKEMELSFRNGIVKDIIHYDNSKSFISKYEHNGELLQKFINENINWDVIPFLDKKKRILGSIITYEDSLRFDILQSDDERLNKEFLRVLRLINQWTKLYSLGKLVERRQAIPYVFEEKNRH